MRYMIDVHYHSGQTKVREFDDRKEARRVARQFKFKPTVREVYFYDSQEDEGEFI